MSVKISLLGRPSCFRERWIVLWHTIGAPWWCHSSPRTRSSGSQVGARVRQAAANSIRWTRHFTIKDTHSHKNLLIPHIRQRVVTQMISRCWPRLKTSTIKPSIRLLSRLRSHFQSKKQLNKMQRLHCLHWQLNFLRSLIMVLLALIYHQSWAKLIRVEEASALAMMSRNHLLSIHLHSAHRERQHFKSLARSIHKQKTMSPWTKSKED